MASANSGFQQPINAIATSTETAYAGQKSQEQDKARFTRAEKRAFAKEKKTAQQARHPKQAYSHKRDSKAPARAPARAPAKNIGTVDDVIAYLLTIRGKEGDRQVQNSLSRVTKTLEGRITRDAPKKAEPSAQKLEKMQKRKEIRAERRKAKLAQRSEQGAQQGAETQAADGAAQVELQQTVVTEFDEINFDEL